MCAAKRLLLSSIVVSNHAQRVENSVRSLAQHLILKQLFNAVFHLPEVATGEHRQLFVVGFLPTHQEMAVWLRLVHRFEKRR